MRAPAEDDVDMVIGECAVEPRPNDAVHPSPVKGDARRLIPKDVILQLVPPQGEEELLAPSGVAGGVDVEDNRDEALDVPHRHRLGAQIQEGGGLMKEEGAVQIAVTNGARGVGGGGVIVVLIAGGGLALAGCAS